MSRHYCGPRLTWSAHARNGSRVPPRTGTGTPVLSKEVARFSHAGVLVSLAETNDDPGSRVHRGGRSARQPRGVRVRVNWRRKRSMGDIMEFCSSSPSAVSFCPRGGGQSEAGQSRACAGRQAGTCSQALLPCSYSRATRCLACFGPCAPHSVCLREEAGGWREKRERRTEVGTGTGMQLVWPPSAVCRTGRSFDNDQAGLPPAAGLASAPSL